jgi:hypothetical protein
MLWWILINYIPLLFCLFLITVGYFHSLWLALILLYSLPPVIARSLIAVFGKPRRAQVVPSKSAYVWWLVTQLQVPFMRLSFLEEMLRLIPGVYSLWLRLWGAKVGSYIFWSPQVVIADRPFVEIGDRVIIGYGAKVTSHFLKKNDGETTLFFGIPKIESNTLLGAMSVVAPGAILKEGSTLEGGAGIHPFSSKKISVLNNSQSIFEKSLIEEG